jgi:hypothetical protein
MPEEDHGARKNNTVGTLWRNQPAELMRNNLAYANGEEIESDFHEGSGSKKEYDKYPKEYFTKSLTFKDKIDLILQYKEITIGELAIAIKISKEELLEYCKQDKIPKDNILIALSNISGYPVSFFKEKSMIATTNSHHRRKVIIAIMLVAITIITAVGGIIYLYFSTHS